jgi:FAD:protein FMN transferase
MSSSTTTLEARRRRAARPAGEHGETFPCFGGRCGVWIGGDGMEDRGSAQTLAAVRRRLLGWHRQFTRFAADSELSRLNEDRRDTVPVSAMMARFVQAAVAAAAMTDGLVDPTLLGEIERAGYRTHHRRGVPLEVALALAPPRLAARPRPDRRWMDIRVDRIAGTVGRPYGVKLDSGGIAKGLFADVIGESLGHLRSYAIDCGGDLHVGGYAGLARVVRVASPFEDGRTLHELELRRGGVATSGIARRSWLDSEGRLAHHLLDPATGAPAYTGIVQATALASTALEAEIRTKAAILSGPDGARRWLADGGALVYDDGALEVIPQPLEVEEPRSPKGSSRSRTACLNPASAARR